MDNNGVHPETPHKRRGGDRRQISRRDVDSATYAEVQDLFEKQAKLINEVETDVCAVKDEMATTKYNLLSFKRSVLFTRGMLYGAIIFVVGSGYFILAKLQLILDLIK